MKTTNKESQIPNDKRNQNFKQTNVVFRTWYGRPPSVKEKPTKDVITVPNQALSIQEILDRFSRGQTLPQTRVPDQEAQEFEMDLSKLDKFERIELLKQVKSSVQGYRDTLAAAEAMEAIQSASGGDKPEADGDK